MIRRHKNIHDEFLATLVRSDSTQSISNYYCTGRNAVQLTDASAYRSLSAFKHEITDVLKHGMPSASCLFLVVNRPPS